MELRDLVSESLPMTKGEKKMRAKKRVFGWIAAFGVIVFLNLSCGEVKDVAGPTGEEQAPEASQVGVVFTDDFSSGLSAWTMEKNDTAVDMVLDTERLRVTTTNSDEGIMVWLNTVELPDEFSFEFDMTPINSCSTGGFNILFF